VIIHNGIARKGTERVIFKYCIDINKWNEIVMPAKAKVLTVQFQLVKPVMWVETNPYTDDKETREFWIVGTGHEFDVIIQCLLALQDGFLRNGLQPLLLQSPPLLLLSF